MPVVTANIAVTDIIDGTNGTNGTDGANGAPAISTRLTYDDLQTGGVLTANGQWKVTTVASEGPADGGDNFWSNSTVQAFVYQGDDDATDNSDFYGSLRAGDILTFTSEQANKTGTAIFTLTGTPTESGDIWTLVGTSEVTGVLTGLTTANGNTTNWGWSRARAGVNGIDGSNGSAGLSVAQLVIYMRSATAPSTPTGGSFNFTTQTLTTPTGWSAEVPSGDDPLYTSHANASVVGQTGTDSTITWSSPDLIVQNGDDGTDGQSTYQSAIYIRATTAPTTPTGGSFNFGTDTLVTPTGWSEGVPTGTNPVYVSRTLFSVIGNTGTDSSPTWSSPVLFAQNGDDGSDGLSTYLVSVFRRSSTALTAPTGGSYNFGTETTTAPTNYSVTPPAGSDPLYVTTALASVQGITGTDSSLTWGIPNIMAVDGTDGTNGSNGSNGTNGTNGTNGDSFRTVYVFRNGTSLPSNPTSSNFTASTGVAAAANGWATTATVPPAGQIIYVGTVNIRQPNSTGNWVFVSGLASPASSSGTNGTNGSNGSNGTDGQDGQDGTDGTDGTNGTNGSNGSDAPRFAEATLYTNPAVATAPSAPSATITWSTGALSSITSGWSQTPPTQTASAATSVYSSQLVFIDTSSPFTTTSTTGGTPIEGVNFDGLVTFTGGDFAVDGATITSIDGGNITTGTITADQIATGTITADQIESGSITAAQIDVDTLILTSANILTIDGSQVATRTHRRTIDDYIDDLLGVVASQGGSANGTNVTGGSATGTTRYRFSADVDDNSLPTPDDEFRTKRFYYPTWTSTNSAYNTDSGRVKFFTVEDYTGAQGTNFYTGNTGNDFYRAGSNNNDRTVMYQIPSPNMYLNQEEVLTLIDPAIEYGSTGRVHIEMQVEGDGTNTPSFTAIEFEAYAINVEEFFTVIAVANPGTTHTFVEDFEEVTNVQLTGTTATLAYAAVLDSNSVDVIGDGTVYGIARGF